MNINPWIIPGLNLTNKRKHDLLIKAICDYYVVTEADFLSKSREGHIVKAKKAICYYLNKHYNLSESVIEKKYPLGLKRITINHHIRTYKSGLEIKDKEIVKLHDNIKIFL